MQFNPLDYPTTFTHSAFLTDSDSWAGHIPFAYLLVELARPSVLVELGTYNGLSYGNFCEAVLISKTGTKCFAIDTWRGDANMGQYADKVLQIFKARHDPRYGSFSTLIQSTFDDALGRFTDGSIDVLHIDGCHTYEAVRHDFESWRPKLSDAAIVLFHDTAVRKEGFGVYRFWEEMSRKYPSFEFKQSNGLGVLGTGRSLPQKFMQFLEDANRDPAPVQSLFNALGEIYFGEIKIRYLLSEFAQQLLAINEYKQRSGQATEPLPDVRAMLKDPVMHARRATRDVISLIAELEGKK